MNACTNEGCWMKVNTMKDKGERIEILKMLNKG